MSIEELEKEAEALRKELKMLEDARDKRIKDLNLDMAIAKLAINKGYPKRWWAWRPVMEFVLGETICYAREARNYFDSWDIWAIHSGEVVYEGAPGKTPKTFKDGPWANNVSDLWKEMSLADEIAMLKKAIANLRS